MFSKEESALLYPTRIPYEESSVFSEVNIKHPDLKKHVKFKVCSTFVNRVNFDKTRWLSSQVDRHLWSVGVNFHIISRFISG